MSSDRNLLAGVLALQLDLVSGEELIAGMNAWALEKDTPLLDVLRRRGALDAADVDAVERLIERRLKRHGDAGKSLAAVRLEDAAVRASLAALSPESTVGPTPLPPGAGMVRYRRLREHARGGLGEVSVALDEELRREVALKEIQGRFADHPEMRERFVREAEITGQLEHPGVVPVYGLGATPDGRPYYAMRFIGGESLEAAIGRHHRDNKGDLRGLLTRFVAVCNAVAFAHSRGVVHRDLKPANVMLGEYGETLVVDWGLARTAGEAAGRSGRPIVLSPHGSGTQEGQAVGTPAFMPPEQASGRLGEVGPPSDVWALGAILYAILTGGAPYGGPTPLVEAAACDPVPPRRVRAGVPAALEAVCRKAMAKDAKGRYAGARELAADVERWLADEPVSAYRDPLSVRLTRWGRKHRTLATALGVSLVVGTAALGAVLAVVTHEQGKTAKALGEAKANLKLARKAVNDCFNVAKSDPLFQNDGMLPAKKLLLARTLPYYRDFTTQGGGEEHYLEEAQQAFAVGYITNYMGQHEESLAAFGRAEEIYQRLAAARDYHHDLAYTLNNIGVELAALGKTDEAMQAYGRAERIRQRLATAYPEAPHFQSALAHTLNNKGLLLAALDDDDEALEAYDLAEKACQRLADAHPHVPDYHGGLADALDNTGILMTRQGRYGEALKAFGRSAINLKRASDAYPALADHKRRLGDAHYNLACVFALSVASLQKGESRPSESREQEADKLTREVLQRLRGAAKYGHFSTPKNREAFAKEGDLKAVRGRTDFKAFVASLDTKGP